jgi:hypothetical protein
MACASLVMYSVQSVDRTAKGMATECALANGDQGGWWAARLRLGVCTTSRARSDDSAFRGPHSAGRRVTVSPDDYVGITQLLARYCQALDFGDAAGLADCFSADGSFEIVGPSAVPTLRTSYIGRAALMEFASDVFRGLQGHARHWIGAPLIATDGWSATAVVYLTVLRAGASPKTTVLLTGLYRDSLIRQDGEWLFARREFSVDPQPEHAGLVPTDELILASDQRAQPPDRK